VLTGVDISQWQGQPNIPTLAANVDFAIIRASYSNTLVDLQGWVNRTQLRGLGTLLGHYHYAEPAASTGPEQARVFLDSVGWLTPGEILALDLEVDAPSLVLWAEMFARIVLNVAGRAPVLYTNPDFLLRYDFTPLYELGCPLWVASWGIPADDFRAPQPWGRALIHQHTSTGHVAGIDGNVDLDAFDGEAADWKAYGIAG